MRRHLLGFSARLTAPALPRGGAVEVALVAAVLVLARRAAPAAGCA